VLVLQGVVVCSGVVARDADVGGLSELVGGEGVHEEEAEELEAVLVGAEHVLVEEVVGTEEEEKALEVDDLGVLY